MALFAVFGLSNDQQMAGVMLSVFPNDHLNVGPGQYLVSAKGTAIDVSNSLGITSGVSGTGIVVSIANYYGHAGTNIWEWLRVKGSGQ